MHVWCLRKCVCVCLLHVFVCFMHVWMTVYRSEECLVESWESVERKESESWWVSRNMVGGPVTLRRSRVEPRAREVKRLAGIAGLPSTTPPHLPQHLIPPNPSWGHTDTPPPPSTPLHWFSPFHCIVPVENLVLSKLNWSITLVGFLLNWLHKAAS